MTTPETSECERCLQRLAGLYLLRGGGGDVLRCTLMHRPTIGRSLKIAIIVGSVLIGINQGDVVLSGQLDKALLWKAPLTYATPFVVSLWGAMANARVQGQPAKPS
ncbi:MAG: nitrate/nitrite transporter NrtS [Candidatus Brocadiia bacterium]|nr:nitrate/nitrite transporter NrtS [Candidatus Brocadiia bacterium]